MPGLINMHAHAAMSIFKGFSDDKSLMDWLRKSFKFLKVNLREGHLAGRRQVRGTRVRHRRISCSI